MNALVVAPVLDAAEYTVSPEIWTALTNEINHVVARIDAGDELTPDDVVNVRSLKKQVENYLTIFNQAMRKAQATYKDLVAKQLDALGYTKIETYIQIQREKQTKEQTQRLAEKQNKLKELVECSLQNTVAVKDTALAHQLLPAFAHRFPSMNSASKSKDIKNWGPYEAVITTTLHLLDVFFMDPAFTGAKTLPITSATMQQLLCYVRDGNMAHVAIMHEVFAKDSECLKVQALQAEITTKEIALEKIGAILAGSDCTATEKIQDIARIIRIAEFL